MISTVVVFLWGKPREEEFTLIFLFHAMPMHILLSHPMDEKMLTVNISLILGRFVILY